MPTYYLLGEEQVGHGGCQCEAPAEEGHQTHPAEVGEREHVERPTDRLVTLQRERQDRQHRGVAGAEPGTCEEFIQARNIHLSERKERTLQNV